MFVVRIIIFISFVVVCMRLFMLIGFSMILELNMFFFEFYLFIVIWNCVNVNVVFCLFLVEVY